ncbi:MAG: DUF302 domain-containing protein [Bryobacteraceae bacterium]
MLQIRSTHGFHATATRLQAATEQAGGTVLAVTDMGALLRMDAGQGMAEPAAATALTLCFTDLYAALLAADIRFAAFLPLRVAVCEKAGGIFLESVSPRECCRDLHRLDLEALATRLEERLRNVIESAAVSAASVTKPHKPTEDQVNMRAALPQRVDCHGTKIEDLAGTGKVDAQGG